MRINPIHPSIRSQDRKPRDNDDVFCAWLKLQKSAFSGKRGHIDPAHFRTAMNSGIAIKPLFSAIPLTHDEHATQHRIGQFNFAPREWWIAQVRFHQQEFIKYGGKIPVKYLVKE